MFTTRPGYTHHTHLLESVWPHGLISSVALTAAAAGSETVLWLLSQCWSDVLLVVDAGGATLAHVTALSGRANVLCFLAKAQGSTMLAAKDASGRTPAHCAAQRGHVDALRVLVEQLGGTDVQNAADGLGRTPAHAAAEHGHIAVLRFLAECLGTSALTTVDTKRFTPAHVAAMRGHVGVLQLLGSEQEALLTAISADGLTPAHLAASYGQVQVLRYLAEQQGGALIDPLTLISLAHAAIRSLAASPTASNGRPHTSPTDGIALSRLAMAWSALRYECTPTGCSGLARASLELAISRARASDVPSCEIIRAEARLCGDPPRSGKIEIHPRSIRWAGCFLGLLYAPSDGGPEFRREHVRHTKLANSTCVELVRLRAKASARARARAREAVVALAGHSPLAQDSRTRGLDHGGSKSGERSEIEQLDAWGWPTESTGDGGSFVAVGSDCVAGDGGCVGNSSCSGGCGGGGDGCGC